jgi:DNA-binding NtrC family response regulator
MPEQPRILIIDDGEMFARLVHSRMPEIQLVGPDLGEHEEPEDENLVHYPRIDNGPDALAYLKVHEDKVDVILLDVNFDIEEAKLLSLGAGYDLKKNRRYQGLAILKALRHDFPSIPVVLLTSEEDLAPAGLSLDLASQSMIYLLDAGDIDALRIRINAALREANLGLEESGVLWGADPDMRSLRRRMAVVARGTMPVILEGETGTGKTYLAERFIHRNSDRRGPFVTLDLSTVPADLISATLFGSVRGAYTGSVGDRKGVFQLAHRGTLFIDEIQNASMEVQKQLLLVLQEGRVRPLGAPREIEVDVKVIVASNSELAKAVAKGQFRADLYMRLGPATRIVLPPLRERPRDLPFLVRHLVKEASVQPHIAPLLGEVSDSLNIEGEPLIHLGVGRSKGLSESTLELILPKPAWDRLQKHDWPGNLRELSMVVQNLVSFTLVAAVDALRSGLSLESKRLQVDPGLVGDLLAGSMALKAESEGDFSDRLDRVVVDLNTGNSLNAVAKSVEQQYFLSLYRQTSGSFEAMADILLGDASRSRSVRLRFNQLGLKVREIRT